MFGDMGALTVAKLHASEWSRLLVDIREVGHLYAILLQFESVGPCAILPLRPVAPSAQRIGVMIERVDNSTGMLQTEVPVRVLVVEYGVCLVGHPETLLIVQTRQVIVAFVYLKLRHDHIRNSFRVDTSAVFGAYET